MSIVSKSFTPSDIFQGPADIWLDLGAPPSAVPPVQYTNTLQLNGAGEPPDSGSAGFHCGLTEGPCALSIHPAFNSIHADQFAGAIDAAFNSLTCEIDFVMKEYNLSKIPKYFAGVLTGSYHALTAGSTNPAADMLQIGSSNSAGINTHTLMLIAPLRNQTAKWMYVLAYKAYLKSAVQLSFDRKKESTIKLKWACLADTSRAPKDQVFQIVRMT